MSLIGKAICRWRELTGRKPVHDMRRVTLREPIFDMGQKVGETSAVVRECTRCGHTMPVKTRGPRKSQEIQK